MGKTISPVEFQSHDTTIRGAWFEAADSPLKTPRGAPCVILAHGLAGTRGARLDAYAERFAAAGLHALVFDYRSFGDSDGQPREHFNIRAQLDDWHAALAHVRSLDQVDPTRIALWGSSFSGGHVVTIAAEDGDVAAVSAQGPMLDGLAAFRNVIRYAGLGAGLKLTGHAIWDVFGTVAGQRHKIAVVAPPGSVAAMSSHDAESGYRAIAPADWPNQITASWMLELPLYRPIAKAGDITCPVLIGICLQDSVAPAEAAERTAQRLGDLAEVRRYDCGHFDIYVGEPFERGVADQIDFFTDVLAPPKDATVSEDS